MPTTGRPFTITFPTGGLNRRFDFESQLPFTTVDCVNVRPFGAVEERQRGGTRPGLRQIDDTGSSSPVDLIHGMQFVPDDNQSIWQDGFNYFDEFNFDLQTSVLPADLYPVMVNGPPPVGVPVNATQLRPVVQHSQFDSALSSDPSVPDNEVLNRWYGATRTPDEPDLDTTAAYEVGFDLLPPLPVPNPVAGARTYSVGFNIFLRLNDSNPNPFNECIRCYFFHFQTATQGVQSGVRFSKIVAGVESNIFAFAIADPGAAIPLGPARVAIEFIPGSPPDYRVRYNDAIVLSPASITDSGGMGHKWGFAYAMLPSETSATSFTVRPNITAVTSRFTEDSPFANTKGTPTILMAGSNGNFYREINGRLAQLTGGGVAKLTTGDAISAVPRGSKLYIADHSPPRASNTNGQVSGTTFTSVTYNGSWDTLGIDTDRDVVRIISGTGPTAGSYPISSVSAASITLASAPGDGTNLTFRVESGAKVYDPKLDTLTLWNAASVGVPAGCPAIARYRDRLVLAGDQNNPNAWYMSRVGSPNDWSFAAIDPNDPLAPVASTTANAGEIGEPILALITHTDDYLLIGCRDSLWVLRGDPAFNGYIDNLSEEIGIIHHRSVCRTPEGHTVFMSRDGLYLIGPNAVSRPEPLSREVLPVELRQLDERLLRPILIYDVKDRGVHIFLRDEQDASNESHWWFDWRTKSFWPVRVSRTQAVTAAFYHESQIAERSAALFGTKAGLIVESSGEAQTDVGTAFAADVWLGPFRLARGDYDGILREMKASLGRGSVDVTWEVYVGANAEEAYNSTPFATGTFVAGYNASARPRARGDVAYIRLSSTAGRWTMENILAKRVRAGESRVLS